MFHCGAHTSNVSFLQTFMTQWYSNEEHAFVMCLQPFLSAALFHSFAVLGHDVTFSAVDNDSLHSLLAFTNICNRKVLFREVVYIKFKSYTKTYASYMG